MKAVYSFVLVLLLSAASALQAELPTKKVLTLGLAKRLVGAAEAAGDAAFPRITCRASDSKDRGS